VKPAIKASLILKLSGPRKKTAESAIIIPYIRSGEFDFKERSARIAHPLLKGSD
jgi:hypothetical protein